MSRHARHIGTSAAPPPLGLITGADELIGKKIVIVASGVQQECIIGSVEAGMEGADCADFEGEEQSMMLACDVEGTLTVIQPNEDGSFWRKIVRNKMIRMKEKRREEVPACAHQTRRPAFPNHGPPSLTTARLP